MRGLRGLVLVSLVSLAACPQEQTADGGKASATAAPTASSEAPTSEEARIALAKKIVEWLDGGEHAKVRDHFDRAMDAALEDEKAIAEMWQDVVGKLGKLEGQIGVRQIKKDKHFIMLVACRFANGPMDVNVIFDQRGRLAGLRVTPSTHPDAYGPRPQTPKPPFPYAAEEVLYDNPTDSSKLGGTLTLPKGDGPFPVVLLITGSGPQDRDSTMFGHKPFLVIADHLTREGIAVLRVDDRGVGKTTGKAATATLQTHASDVTAGVAFLKKHAKIDPKRIGLIGHSEGGVIAPMVAAESTDVAFVVSLAGPTVSGAELNPMQVKALLEAEGKPADGVAKVVQGQRELMQLIVDDAPEAELKKKLAELVEVAAALDPENANDVAARQTIATEFQRLLSPWFRSWAKHDPAGALAKLDVPILIMIGDKDSQVPAAENLAKAKTALSNNPKARLESLSALNHLFQKAETGALDEYAKLSETFNPAALELMTTWLLETTGAGP